MSGKEGVPPICHIDDYGQASSNNWIHAAILVEDEHFGDAIRLHIEGCIAQGATATEIYLDAENAEALWLKLGLMVVKLNQIAELRPYVTGDEQ